MVQVNTINAQSSTTLNSRTGKWKRNQTLKHTQKQKEQKKRRKQKEPCRYTTCERNESYKYTRVNGYDQGSTVQVTTRYHCSHVSGHGVIKHHLRVPDTYYGGGMLHGKGISLKQGTSHQNEFAVPKAPHSPRCGWFTPQFGWKLPLPKGVLSDHVTVVVFSRSA